MNYPWSSHHPPAWRGLDLCVVRIWTRVGYKMQWLCKMLAAFANQGCQKRALVWWLALFIVSKVSSGMVPSEGRGGRISSRLWLASLSSWLVFPLHVRLCDFFLFYKDTIRVGFGHILIDSFRFHPLCKNPFPNEVTFWATGTRTLV